MQSTNIMSVNNSVAPVPEFTLKTIAQALRQFAEGNGLSFSVEHTADILSAMAYSRMLIFAYKTPEQRNIAVKSAQTIQNFFSGKNNTFALNDICSETGTEREAFFSFIKSASDNFAVSFAVLTDEGETSLQPLFGNAQSFFENPREDIILGNGNIAVKLPHNIWFAAVLPEEKLNISCGSELLETAAVLYFTDIATVKSAPHTPQGVRITLDEFDGLCEDAARTLPVPDETTWRKLDALDNFLKKEFHCGIGHIFRNHAELFVPVTKACDGNITTAIDRLLANRLTWLLFHGKIKPTEVGPKEFLVDFPKSSIVFDQKQL